MLFVVIAGVIVVCCLGDGLVLFVVTGGGVTRCVIGVFWARFACFAVIRIIYSEKLVFNVSPSIT